MWRRNRNICGYWNCDKRIRKEDFLCAGHYESWVNGLIDRCPKCGRFKDVMYQLCLDCYIGRPVKPWEPSVEVPPQKQHYKVEYSDAWVDGYMQPDKCFVYILEVDDGVLYVGHTKDLRERLTEHREQKKSSTAGHDSKLQYVEIVATQEVAKLREDELKRLMESNPGQIQAMISDFRSHMRVFGYKEDS